MNRHTLFDALAHLFTPAPTGRPAGAWMAAKQDVHQWAATVVPMRQPAARVYDWENES